MRLFGQRADDYRRERGGYGAKENALRIAQPRPR